MSKIFEYTKQYLNSNLHSQLSFSSIMGFTAGLITSDDNNILKKPCGYAIAGYFLPITIAYQGLTYWYNKIN